MGDDLSYGLNTLGPLCLWQFFRYVGISDPNAFLSSASFCSITLVGLPDFSPSSWLGIVGLLDFWIVVLFDYWIFGLPEFTLTSWLWWKYAHLWIYPLLSTIHQAATIWAYIWGLGYGYQHAMRHRLWQHRSLL